ncbi:alkaline shock response membrane anchor protein AmaP [Shimazuella sp. AN120528]|uniref:alkaline shock response membrane anchor protein AmaP n=1 Tax=Shimazuella soli TaxID=1892854 RepID=UPI001F114536|nr:alkaline shock response membrane anchor protein AmaP [Shimazuella soli]MCH5585298.1 alkaline shock response membrane anchor protein AmaP [Shimazuella soli]
MWSLVMSPIFWIGVALVIVAIIVLSALISSKRSREVDELGTYFPDGELDNTTRIPVEKVRRSTLARQQRKQASQHLPRRQPREDVLELDKQEYVNKQEEQDDLELDDYEQEEENLNLPAVQDSLTSDRQFNRKQYKSSILQSRNTALTTDENFTNKRPSFARRTPLNSNNNTSTTNTTTNNSRSPLRRPLTNKTAYPSLRKDSNSTANTEEDPSPRFPNRRSKRMF